MLGRFLITSITRAQLKHLKRTAFDSRSYQDEIVKSLENFAPYSLHDFIEEHHL